MRAQRSSFNPMIAEATMLVAFAKERRRDWIKDSGTPLMAKLACETWMDVPAFGQLFALPAKKSKSKDADNNGTGDTDVSVPIRGPVTVQSAFRSDSTEANLRMRGLMSAGLFT